MFTCTPVITSLSLNHSTEFMLASEKSTTECNLYNKLFFVCMFFKWFTDGLFLHINLNITILLGQNFTGIVMTLSLKIETNLQSGFPRLLKLKP